MTDPGFSHAEADLRSLLADLGELEVLQQASTIAERFKIPRPDVLKIWKQERKDGQSGKKRQLAGRPISELLKQIDPWPEEVDGAQWLEECEYEVRRYLAMPEGAYLTVATWNLYTHVWKTFGYAPYLVATSPTSSCGKSTLLRLCHRLSELALFSGSMTQASLFRIVDAHHPVLLLDEQDGRLERNEEMRLLLNEGFQSGQWVMRCVGDDAEPRGFDCFGPKALASIGALPKTILSRSLVIPMERSREPLVSLGPDAFPEALTRLQRQAARWSIDHIEELGGIPEIPGLDGRLADKWGPLLAVGQVAGGNWLQRLVGAAQTLDFDDSEEAEHLALLADIGRFLDCWGWPPFIATERLLTALNDLPEAPWSEAGPKKDGLSAAGLARLLKMFRLKPEDEALIEGGQRRRGYATAPIRRARDIYVSSDISEGELCEGVQPV